MKTGFSRNTLVDSKGTLYVKLSSGQIKRACPKKCKCNGTCTKPE